MGSIEHESTSGTNLADRSAKWTFIAAMLLLLVVAGWFVVDGPKLAPDSQRYLNGAQELRQSGTITGKATRYSGYVFLVMLADVVSKGSSGQLWVVAAVQVAALSGALFCLWRLGIDLFGATAGNVAALLFASNVYLLRWAPYVLPTTLFTSFIVISCYLCALSTRKPAYLPAAIAAIIVTTSLRPNGIALLPVFVIYLLFSQERRARWMTAGLLAIVLLPGIPVVQRVLDGSAQYEQLVERMKVGTIIWSEDPVDHVEIEGRTGSQMIDLVRYVAVHPLHSGNVMAKRLFRSYSFQRDDYSTRHRLLLGVLMPLLLGSALFGLVRAIRTSESKHYLLLVALIATQSVVIAISFADHDHRFISYITPLIFLFVGNGFARVSTMLARQM